jgi:hypothetical protein
MADHARITSYAGGASAAFALGDLTPVYTGNVKKLERGIVYISPRTALIIDRLETKNGEAVMDALFHSRRMSDVEVRGTTFTIGSGEAKLAGAALCAGMTPEIAVTPDPVKLGMLTDNPIEPMGRITVSTRTSGGQCVAAILLGGEGRIKEKDGTSLIELDGANVLVNGGQTTAENGGIVTDGLCAAVIDGGGILMAVGTACTIDGTMTLSADTPATILMEGADVHYSVDRDTTIRVRTGAPVKEILLDGVKLKEWRYDRTAEMLSVPVRKGQGKIGFGL